MADRCTNEALNVLEAGTDMQAANCVRDCGQKCTGEGHGECRSVQCITKSEIRFCTTESAEDAEFVPVEVVRLVTMRLCAADKQRESLTRRLMDLKKKKEKMDNGNANEKVRGLVYKYHQLLIKIELAEELLRHNEVNLEGLRDVVNRKYMTQIGRMFFEQVCEEFRSELMAKKEPR